VTRKFELPNGYDLIATYMAGKSVKQISEELGVSRPVVTRRLRQAGIEVRGASDQGRIVWAGIKAQGRAAVVAQCRSAWRAARGRVDSAVSIRHRMATRAKTGTYRGAVTGPMAEQLAHALRLRGFQAFTEAAYGVYCLDIFLPVHRIAVEVSIQTYHPLRHTRLRERCEYILDKGTHLYNVTALVADRTFFDCGAIADDFFAWAQSLGYAKPGRGQHRMVWGNAKPRA
jgi:hypothetical protein